jgi:PIN domain nuclease of toxin-antitoxin system
MLNLDTHIVLDSLAGKLESHEARLMRRHPVGISAIVFWEIAELYRLKKINLPLDDPDLTELLNSLHVWPISREVCLKLSDLDFHSDPADELIAATSLAHRVPLLTRDRRILASRKVPLA